MRRWLLFFLCLVLGVLIVLLGWIVPAHLRAVDAHVVQKAGKNTPSLTDRGLALLSEKRLGAAQMLFKAAEAISMSERQWLGAAITNAAEQHPSWLIWGGGESDLDVLFATDPKLPKAAPEPFTEWLIRLDNRGTALRFLGASARPLVRELLATRSLTNTVLFPPSQSSSGQAFDAAISICALLAEETQLSAQANRGASTEPVEEVLMNLMSLGQRMNWGQLVVFVSHIDDPQTLQELTHLIRRTESRVPIIYSAVELSSQPGAVARYLMKFGETGVDDLGAVLRFRQGALNELLRRGERLYVSTPRAEDVRSGLLKPFFDFSVERSLESPDFALGLKWLLYLFGGCLLAAGAHFVRPEVSELERPLQVRGLHFAREILFGLGFLLVILLLTEPFLSHESQKVEFPLRLRLPLTGAAVTKTVAGQNHVFMNQKSLLTLLLFFVLQGLLYIACLVKLAEIRRQKVAPRIKLRLLENEEHLFDAGLYLGFAGTIISLILVSLKIMEASLMAAYGSTSFGIIFVSIFKIFHLRPTRRRMLLESETSSDTSMLVRPVHSTP